MSSVDSEESYLSKLPYRPSVGLMILNNKLEVFVGRRIDSRTEAWQMPQGGIDEGELPHESALREMQEEIGSSKAEIISETKQWYNYDLPLYLVGKLWNGKYRGQRQKWFLLKFLGKDSDININSQHPEFIEWKWVKIEDLPQIIVPFKKNLYLSVIEEFRDVILDLKNDIKSTN